MEGKDGKSEEDEDSRGGRKWHDAASNMAFIRRRRRDKGAGSSNQVTETAPTRCVSSDKAMKTSLIRLEAR